MSNVIELARTNDLVVISLIESLFKEEGIELSCS